MNRPIKGTLYRIVGLMTDLGLDVINPFWFRLFEKFAAKIAIFTDIPSSFPNLLWECRRLMGAQTARLQNPTPQFFRLHTIFGNLISLISLLGVSVWLLRTLLRANGRANTCKSDIIAPRCSDLNTAVQRPQHRGVATSTPRCNDLNIAV